MEPGLSARSGFALRSSTLLYKRNGMPGKKEVIEKKNIFKAHQNALRITRNTFSQNRDPPEPVKTGPNKSIRSSKAFAGTDKKQNQSNAKFLRPPVDMLAARKRVLERALRLGEVNGNDVEGKKLNIKNHNVMKKLNFGCTPKQTPFAKVCLKLSQTAKKAARSTQLIPTTPTSPFGETIVVCGKANLDNTDIVNNSCIIEKNLDNTVHSNESKVLIKCSSAVDGTNSNQESQVPLVVVSSPGSKKLDNNVSEKDVNSIENMGSSTCAANNILKHFQLYFSKISTITHALTCLDDSFQSVIITEVGGQIHSKFCEYQKKKLVLYRELKLLEEELEEAVRQEIDLESKFQEYLRKKCNIRKEESDLREEFKNNINKIIQDYEEELIKPPTNNNLDEILKILTSSRLFGNNSDIENEKPALPKSERVLRTPKVTETISKIPRVLRSNSKNIPEEDFVTKKSTGTKEKRRVQRSIHKDL